MPVWVGSSVVAVDGGTVAARARVATLLAGLETSGSFSARATMRPDELHMEVRGVGPLGLPVSAQQAKRLISVARPAKYGLGERTLLDQQVRDTWEVPKSRVRIDNRRWRAALRPVLEQLRGELGLPDGCRLKPEFHSMLVYAPGQHFAPHQDSEKSDGMVASLVVTLPGSATGGSLVVEHGTERATYRGSRDRLSLVAFYADCRHEIRPVRTGFRVVLTYNLVLVGDSTGQALAMADDSLEEISECLHEHFSTPVPAQSWRRDPGPLEPPDRLVYLRDHEYTERALGWARLKGTDAMHAAAIRAAAERVDCEVVLALADVHETWSAFESDDDPRWGRYSHRSRCADDIDSNDDDSVDGDYDLDELIESDISLVHWVDESGRSGEAISTSVDDAEVCASTPSSKLTPYESDYEPYMGNYGNTLDRWYRRAAIVVWPRERAFVVRAQGSPRWALDQVTVHLDAGETDAARELVQRLAPFWDAVVPASSRHDVVTGALNVAAGVDDADLASVLLAPFSVEALDVADAPAVATLCRNYGQSWWREVVAGWSRRRRWGSVDRAQWVGQLPGLIGRLLAEQSGGEVAATVIVHDARQWLEDSVARGVAIEEPTRRAGALGELSRPLLAVVESVALLGAVDVRDQMLEWLATVSDDVVFDRFLVDVIRSGAEHLDPATRTATGLDAIGSWCVDRIERRRARPARSADDWSITLPVGCDCDLCTTLGAFLADPGARTREWPIAKPKRQHVHRRIDAAELPVTHQTRRQGSPHKLILTKTDDLFDREAQDRRRDDADLEWLRATL